MPIGQGLRDTQALSLDVNDVIRRLDSVAKSIADPKQRRQIVRRHAVLVVKAAQQLAPRSDKAHFQYFTSGVKLAKGIRTQKGAGLKRAKYDPGNLKGSIQVLPLRKTADAIIGPRVQRGAKEGDIFGPISGRYNAYYAQMIYGSAKAFRDKIMVRALVSVQVQLIKGIGDSALRIIRAQARKQKLAG